MNRLYGYGIVQIMKFRIYPGIIVLAEKSFNPAKVLGD